MNEAGEQKEDQALSQCGTCKKMSIEEKVNFWFKYAAVAFLGAFSIPPFLYLVVKAARLGRLGWFAHQQVFPILALQALFIGVLIVFLVKRLIQRKRKTGSFMPIGQKLEAARRRRRLFEKILVLAFFYFLAIAFTAGALQAHSHKVSGCAFLIIMWLIAICFTVLALLPSDTRRLDAVVAALLCLAGIFSAYNAVTNQQDRGIWLLFSGLMWTVATICAVDTIRSFARKKTLPVVQQG